MTLVTREKLDIALNIAAQIVTRDGSGYVPIFERIETEIETCRARDASIARASALASLSPDGER